MLEYTSCSYSIDYKLSGTCMFAPDETKADSDDTVYTKCLSQVAMKAIN